MSRLSRVEKAALLLLCIATVAPLWVGRYPPLLDYPNHLSNLFIWRHLHDAKFRFDQYYTTNLLPLPYWTQYTIEYPISFVVGVESAQKIFISLSMLGLPFAVARYARSVGRDPRLALFAFPLAWNANTANGFISYNAALVFLFLALALFENYLRRPHWRLALWIALCGGALYFSHILGWAMFVVIAAVCAAASAITSRDPKKILLSVHGPLSVHPERSEAKSKGENKSSVPFDKLRASGAWRRGRQILHNLLPLVPVGAIAAMAAYFSHPASAKLPVGGVSSFGGPLNDVLANLSMMPSWLVDFFPGSIDEVCLILLMGIWLCILLLRREPGTASLHLTLASLVVLALYLCLPRSLVRPFYWFAVNRRIAVVVVLFLVLQVRGSLSHLQRAALGVAAVISLTYLSTVSLHFYRFNQRARDFETVLGNVPEDKAVMPLMMKKSDREVNVHAYNQWGAYIQLRQGGYVTPYFAVDFPLRLTVPERAAASWLDPTRFNFSKETADWDYILVHRPYARDPFQGHRNQVKLVSALGEWEMWEIVRAKQ